MAGGIAVAMPNTSTRKRPPLCGLVLTRHSEAVLVEIADDVPPNIRMVVEGREGESSVARLMVEVSPPLASRHGTDHDSKPLPPLPGICLPVDPVVALRQE